MQSSYEIILELIQARKIREANALLDEVLEQGSSPGLLWASHFLAFVQNKSIPYDAINFKNPHLLDEESSLVVAGLPSADFQFIVGARSSESVPALRMRMLREIIASTDSTPAECLQAQVDLGTLYFKTGQLSLAQTVLEEVEPLWKSSLSVSEFTILLSPAKERVFEIFEFWNDAWRFNGSNYLDYLQGLEIKQIISKRSDTRSLLNGFKEMPANPLEASKMAIIYSQQKKFALALDCITTFFARSNMRPVEHWIEVYSLSKLGYKSKALDAFKSIRLNNEHPSWFIIFYFEWMIINVKPEGEALRNATQTIYRFLINDPDNTQLLRLLRIYLFASKKFNLLFKRSKSLMEDSFFVKG